MVDFLSEFEDVSDAVDNLAHLYFDDVAGLIESLCMLYRTASDVYRDDLGDLLMNVKAHCVGEYMPERCRRLLALMDVTIDNEDYESARGYLHANMAEEVLVNFINAYSHLPGAWAALDRVVSLHSNRFIRRLLAEHAEQFGQGEIAHGVLGDDHEDFPGACSLLKNNPLSVLVDDGGVQRAYGEVLRGTAEINLESMT